MTDSRAAVGLDRLPWLPDEPAPAKGPPFVAWIVAAVMLVAAAAYWLGTTSTREEPSATRSAAPAVPKATIHLPEPVSTAGRQVEIAPAPQVRPTPAPSVRIVTPRTERFVRRAPAQRRQLRREVPSRDHLRRVVAEQSGQASAPATAPARPHAAARPRPLTLWPARESAGASGRLVQIGAFGTRLQAKKGWWYMARAYPAVRRLPAVVVEARNTRGRPFYRFQIGTTSQAHSEVLCQRMHRIRFSCAVVGLPGAKRAVER